MNEYNIVMFGSYEVGKSAFIERFVKGHYLGEGYCRPMEDCYRKQVEFDGELCILYIEDSVNIEKNPESTASYMKDGQGFILIYSITDEKSLNYLRNVREKILAEKGKENVPMVLVGSLCDLDEKRVVTKTQGENLAQQFGNCTFLEASSKLDLNVTEIFHDIVNQINRANIPIAPSSKKKKRITGCVVL